MNNEKLFDLISLKKYIIYPGEERIIPMTIYLKDIQDKEFVINIKKELKNLVALNKPEFTPLYVNNKMFYKMNLILKNTSKPIDYEKALLSCPNITGIWGYDLIGANYYMHILRKYNPDAQTINKCEVLGNVLVLDKPKEKVLERK